MTITTEIVNGRTYYNTEARGVKYCFYFDGEAWGLHSKRKNMSTFGQFRWFRNLEEIEAKIKAFRGIAAILGAGLVKVEA
jgi:hypothetical protein